MYHQIAKLMMYGSLREHTILYEIGEIFRRFDTRPDSQTPGSSDAELIRDIYTQIRKLLEVATDYGFDKNLWHNYLTFLLITNENPFSLTCEKVGANEGSVNIFAKNDFQVFYNLFHFDFQPLEDALDIDCFRTISHYRAIGKKEMM